MSGAHTPGPWGLTPSGDSVPWLHVHCFDSKGPWHSSRSDDEKIANARLIAAAPGLLEALESVTRAQVDGVMGDRKVWDVQALNAALPAIHAAIAKARGPDPGQDTPTNTQGERT